MSIGASFLKRLWNADPSCNSSSSSQGTTAETEPVLTLVTALVLVVVVVVVEELVVKALERTLVPAVGFVPKLVVVVGGGAT